MGHYCVICGVQITRCSPAYGVKPNKPEDLLRYQQLRVLTRNPGSLDTVTVSGVGVVSTMDRITAPIAYKRGLKARRRRF
ncbi:hypothetical protein BDW74DRAFT_172277 [Aspergillus multicolor]|uniref:uncharacterized protein n=1 Tax=Aspergillus multicolor TaxID=41759 RepID=UPI003CCD37F6